MQKEAKKTSLHSWHVAHGANMVDFGEYNMPLWYPSGAKMEHLTVITKAGIFDTSHMAVVMAKGKDAFELLQFCFSRDLRSCVGKNKTHIEPGKCVYGVFLNELGELIDDALVYLLERDLYMIVVNAGMGDEITRQLRGHMGRLNVEVTDLTDKITKMDLQGPMSARILISVLKDPEKVFEAMYYFTFKGHFDKVSTLADNVRFVDGTPALISRSGYTGEFGFEIFVDPDYSVRIWEMILHAGQNYDLIPCGLAARDSLRAGAVLPLSHVDTGPWPFINHPWLFVLPYNADKTGFTKKFIGDNALKNIDKPEYTYAFAGYDLRKVSHDTAVVLDSGGDVIGSVLTCVTDMAIGRYESRIYSITSPDKPENFEPRGLSCGFLKVKSKLLPGQILELKDSRRKIKVMIADDIRPDRTARRAIKKMM